MEEIDLHILEQLARNCRVSDSELSKMLKKPRHVIAYHRQQLIKNKIITHNELILDYRFLGYNEYIVYLKFSQFAKIQDSLTEFILNHPNIPWCSLVFSNYSIRLLILARSIEEFEKIIDEFETLYFANLIKKEVLIVREVIKEEKFSTKTDYKSISKITLLTLNEREKKLVISLHKAPNDSLVSLANKTGMTIEGVRQKINRFKQIGFFKGFTAKIDLVKLDVSHFWCVLLLNLNNLEKNSVKLKHFLYSDVTYGRTRKIFGEWDVEMTLYVKSYFHLQDIISNLESLFGDDLRDYELLVYTKKIMEKRIPAVLLKD